MKAIATILATACMFASADCAGAIIDDGSFELAELATNNSNSGWTLAESAPNGPGATFESFAASDGEIGVWFRPFVGSNLAPAFAHLSQTINNVSGGDYYLYFDAARELHFSADSFVATFFSSGGLSNNIDLNAAAMNLPSNMFANPTTFVISLLGVSAGDDLTIDVEMTGGTLVPDNPQSAFVDNFRMVPEPSSIVLAALGLVGLVVWRRRKRRLAQLAINLP